MIGRPLLGKVACQKVFFPGGLAISAISERFWLHVSFDPRPKSCRLFATSLGKTSLNSFATGNSNLTLSYVVVHAHDFVAYGDDTGNGFSARRNVMMAVKSSSEMFS